MKQSFTLLLLFSLSIVKAQLATEPTAQPTNLRKDGIDKAFVMDIRFDASGANGYLVLRSKQPINANPVDGVDYTKGEGLGNAKVFSTSNASFLRIRELEANTPYYFAVFAYNITGSNTSSINYLTTNPLTATITSAGSTVGNYYDNIDFNSTTLLNDLKALINPHTLVDYDAFDNTIIADFFERDTANGQKVINCQYSNEYRIYTPPFDWTDDNYSREHRMAFSWINFSNITRPDFETTPEGCDIHALELVQYDVNTARLNYPFGEATQNIAYTYQQFKRGRDANNKDVAEVMESRKGDVARAMFYMMTAYNGKYSSNWGLDNLLSDAENQDVDILLDWHAQDPPDGFEIARHEYVVSKQGNRNPYIDFPALANCIDFTNMTLKASCSGVGVAEIDNLGLVSTYPNPTDELLNVTIPTTIGETATVSVLDINGKVLQTILHSTLAGNSNLVLSVADYADGYYLLNISGTNGSMNGKFIVTH